MVSYPRPTFMPYLISCLMFLALSAGTAFSATLVHSVSQSLFLTVITVLGLAIAITYGAAAYRARLNRGGK